MMRMQNFRNPCCSMNKFGLSFLSRSFSTGAHATQVSSEAYKQLPYFIARTSLGRCLPVYSEFKAHNHIYTLVRRIHGNINVSLNCNVKELGKDLERLLPGTAMEIRQDLMQIKIKGHQVEAIKKFLTEKGF